MNKYRQIQKCRVREPSVKKNGKVIFRRFLFNACNLDSMHYVKFSLSAAGMATFSRIRRPRSCMLCFCILSFSTSSSFTFSSSYSSSSSSSSNTGVASFFRLGLKLFQDAKRGIHMFRGESIERSVLGRLQASGAASRPEYEVCYSETNLVVFCD